MDALHKNSTVRNLNNESVFLSINTALSSSGTIILNAIYENPGIQHKVLATVTQRTVTSLSNCISRLESIQPPLLIIDKNGRSKFYFLSEVAKQYVEQVLLSKPPSNIHSFTSSSYDASKTSETIEIVNHFREIIGEDWDIELYEMLYNHSSAENNELNELFTNFIKNMITFVIQQKTESLQEIYSFLGQNILTKKIEHYLCQLLKNYYILEPLFHLEKNDTEKAFFIIDDIFSELDSSKAFSKTTDIQPLTEDQYNAIFYHINTMIRSYKQDCTDKKTLIERWKKVYYTINPTLLYLAEKLCSSYSS